MDSNGNANPPSSPVININIDGTGTQLRITAPVAIADGGSVAQADAAAKQEPSEAGEEPPYWRRTAVVWSAVAALAALAGVAFSAWSTR